VFKVVQSYEGGCPVSADGNLGDFSGMALPEIPVTLPEGLKAGEAVFVWTWFNRIGNREMYMNCAPITIGGSSTSDAVFNSLPDMFVANINGAPNNACTTKEGVDIVFPNPGANVKVVDGGKFDAACAGGPSTPGASGNSPAPTSEAPPSVTTQPALIGGPGLGVSTGIIGTSFSNIGTPSSVAPAPVETTMSPSTQMEAPVQTTFMTISTIAAAPVQSTMMSVSTMIPSSTQNAPVATPTQGTGGDSGNGTFVVGSCDPTKAIIMCSSSDPTMYTQCYDNNMAYGPFAVPPGTECDSTGMGGFKAMKAVSSRFVRRNLGRNHRRTFAHSNSF